MMSIHLLLIIHLICATIWVGGHIYLCIIVLPKVLKTKDATALLQFEKSYEKLGMPALLILVISGLWMATKYGVVFAQLFSFKTPVETIVSLKLLLLITTVLFALSAQLRVLPKLRTGTNKINEMAFHIIAVTLIGITMLVLGTFVRFGGL